MLITTSTRRARIIRWALIAMASAAWAMPSAPSVQAQTYPAKPVRILVGVAAGGGLDTSARLVAAKLGNVLGQQFVVENRTGASSTIAAHAVATARPDGYTLLYAASTLLIAPGIFESKPFDPLKSFTPIGGVGSDPLLIVVNNNVPARSVPAFIALLKSNPDKFTYGSTGVGSVHHLAMELFCMQAGTSMLHIPYRGASQIIVDLLGGSLPVAMVSASAGVPQFKAGKIRAIAHTRPGRLAIAPEVPPIAETFAGFDAAPAQFILGPANLPQDVLERLGQAMKTVLSSEDVRDAFSKHGAAIEHLDSKALAARMQAETPMWREILKKAGVLPN